LGLLSIVLLIAQLRQTAAWNRVLAYHEYFGDIPSEGRVASLSACLQRLGIPEPSSGEPISTEDAKRLFEDEGAVLGADGVVFQKGQRVLCDYLNDFEEFCGAVNAGVLYEPYVRELEGSRTINAYFGFEEVIKLIRDQEIKRRQLDSQHAKTGAAAQNLLQVHRKPYQELRRVAVLWKRRREAEFQKLLKLKNSHREREEYEEAFDGVPPAT
jgi:hypothetical protein